MATVLVVDDQHRVAALFDGVLTDMGHRVLTAATGKHGLEVLDQERVDLVFLDFMMPVMSASVMLEMMMDDQVLQKIPVIIMSVLPEKILAARCSGYVGVLKKPFRVSQLKSLIDRLEI